MSECDEYFRLPNQSTAATLPKEMPMPSVVVKPIHANYSEAIDIHWRGKDGRVVVERRTCPPDATLKAKATPVAITT